jgi:U3 small nucleolar RNA-associated protein 20
MAVLIRDVKYHTIDTEQLKILLLYAEQDMHDHDRQATGFSLLKAIISRQLIVPEIDDVMAKVAELSITSELSHVRAQSRAVFHQYLMDYPLGNKLETHLSFYLSQMSYELQFGRESAIEMISSLISSFPMVRRRFLESSLF